MSVEEKVISLVVDHLKVPKEEVNRGSRFTEDLKADSLDIVELIMDIEEEFDISIPDEDYEKIKTVGDAVTYIEERK